MGLNMRKGFLGALALLIGSTAAQAQQWPNYGYQQWPAYGYPQYNGYGYQQYSGYYPGYTMSQPGGYYQGYQQSTPQQVQVNSGLVYPRAGYATPTNQPANSSQSTGYSPVPAPRVVSLPQTVSQSVPEPLPAGPEINHPTSAPSAPLVPEPVLPPASACGPACEQNDLLVPPKEPVHERPPRPCKHECFWLTGNFLMAWTKPATVAPLLTTGFTGVGGVGGDTIPGALGQPNTNIVFGNQKINFNLIEGFQLGAGLWLDHDDHFALELSGFYLPLTHQNFAFASDAAGNPLLARPIINPVTNQEEAFIVAFPGLVSGNIAISNSQTLWGAELNGRCYWPIGSCFQLSALGGIRYLNLVETLAIDEQLTPLAGAGLSGLTFLANAVDPPDIITTHDSFRTANQFTGFQLGGALRWDSERFFFDVHAKAAVGANQQSVNITGNSVLLGPTGPIAGAPGGILALPSNIGNHNRTVVAVVPEGGFTAGVNLTSYLRLIAGYSFLYWNNVVRPTSHIDRVVNPTQVPTDADFAALGGPGRPTFQFHEDGFWVHMFNIGLEFHY